METCAVVATHHKTGTVWMRGIFRELTRLLGIRFVVLDRRSDQPRHRFQAPVVVLDDHAEFNYCKWILEDPETRLFHLIRDPRDIIISAAHYHCTSSERWLRWRRKEFGGASYQKTIRQLQTDGDRYFFEMDNSAGEVISAMRSWNYGMPNAMELRYEQLIADEGGIVFGRVLEHLGFEPHEVECGREQFLARSINGADPANPPHVRSGKTRQWAEVFDRRLAGAFLSKFGDVLIKLGYEMDDGWVELLPEASQSFQRAEQLAADASARVNGSD